MDPELQSSLLKAKTPQALSETLIEHCIQVGKIQKIEFFCNCGDIGWNMICFLTTNSQAEAHSLASYLRAGIFGDRSVFFEIPLAGDAACDSFPLKPGKCDQGSGTVLCKCSR